MKHLFLMGLVLALGLVSANGPADAQLYQYVDENGILTFTDDASKLSANQRHYTAQWTDSQPPFSKNVSHEPAAAAEKPSQGQILDQLLREREALEAAKQTLMEEYADIDAERGKLTRLREDLKKDTDVEAAVMENFRKRVSLLNEKTNAYDGKVKAYRQRLNAYNQRVDQFENR